MDWFFGRPLLGFEGLLGAQSLLGRNFLYASFAQFQRIGFSF